MRYKELRTKRALSSKVDPYIDGLQAIGDHLLLKGLPGKKKEKLFWSVIPRDPWQHRWKQVQSIRAGKALETVLDQQPKHTELAIKANKGTTKVVNKDLELKTYEYKVFTTYDINTPAIKSSSSLLGIYSAINYLGQVFPSPPANSQNLGQKQSPSGEQSNKITNKRFNSTGYGRLKKAVKTQNQNINDAPCKMHRSKYAQRKF